MIYDDNFYEMVKAEALPSAEVVVERVMGLLNPKTVIDVGCGQGVWTAEFMKSGCKVVGVDGDYVSRSHLEIPVEDFVVSDLNESINVEGKFDLSVSLEVAEHLSPSRADSFIRELCELAPITLFSAAFPGQGGVDHVNERDLDYWVNLFEKNDRVVSGALRWMVWDDADVAPYYKSNMIVAADPKYARTLGHLFGAEMSKPYPVVHPATFKHVVGI